MTKGLSTVDKLRLLVALPLLAVVYGLCAASAGLRSAVREELRALRARSAREERAARMRAARSALRTMLDKQRRERE